MRRPLWPPPDASGPRDVSPPPTPLTIPPPPGLVNNVLYVIILSAAQDLVGTLPKGIVLLADVVPSFFVKLVAPYVIDGVPYRVRVVAFVALSAAGMLMVALAPADGSVAVKLAGVVLASVSSGGGELSFLGLSHYYGHVSLVGWGSGTGAAGLVGAGLYVALTEWWRLSVRDSLLLAACLPAVMLASFFCVLPQGPLRRGRASKDYETVAGDDDDGDGDGLAAAAAASALLAPRPPPPPPASLRANLARARALVVPYMAPLLLVYVAEYTINQGVAPTLLFPVASSPFAELRGFYPFYGFLYQLGVFISRSSTPFVRVRRLYLPALLQAANLALLTLHALYFFLPSVYLVFALVFWEGLLGGAVYVNCFADIMERVPPADREFSLAATTVSDSAGICVAGLASIAVETRLCDYQVAHGRPWCRQVGARRA